MKLFDVLKLAYETFGAKHPTGSLIAVMVLGGVLGTSLCGALWAVAAKQYSHTKEVTAPVKETINTTNGPRSPIISGNRGSISINGSDAEPVNSNSKDKVQ